MNSRPAAAEAAQPCLPLYTGPVPDGVYARRAGVALLGLEALIEWLASLPVEESAIFSSKK